MSKFSTELRKQRKGKGYTQKELADIIGVSESTIGMYERGQREPDFETLEAIADTLNVFMSDLIEEKTATPEDDGLSPTKKELLNLFDTLNEDEAREIVDFARYKANKSDQ